MNTRHISWGQRWPVLRANNVTTIMYRCFWNPGASTSWNPQGLSRPVMGLLYLYILTNYFCRTDLFKNLIFSRMVQNVPAFHGTTNMHCVIHNSLPFVPILDQINPGYALHSYFLKIHFNINSHLQRGLPSGFPSLRFSHQNPLCIRFLPIRAIFPARFFLLLSPQCYLLHSKIILLFITQFQLPWLKTSFPESCFWNTFSSYFSLKWKIKFYTHTHLTQIFYSECVVGGLGPAVFAFSRTAKIS